MSIKSIFTSIGHYFEGFFKGIIGQAAVSLEAAIKDFLKTDVGEAALAGVEYAATLTGQADASLRDAARQHMLDLLAKSGKDLKVIGQSQLNLFIEMAYTGFKSKLAEVSPATK